MKKLKNVIIPAAIFIFAAGVFICCILLLSRHEKEFDVADSVYSLYINEYADSEISQSKHNPNNQTDISAESFIDNRKITNVNDINDYSSGIVENEEAPVDVKRFFNDYPECVGWIYIPGTPVSYPIMQADNNDYYLRKLPDGRYNICGSIFLDCNNSPDFSDRYSIIYGHHFKKNNLMFGSIVNYKSKEFCNEHNIIYVFNKNEKFSLIPLFAFIADENDRAYSISQFYENVSDSLLYFRSKCEPLNDISYTEHDSFIILSTCSYEYNNARFVLICKILK